MKNNLKKLIPLLFFLMMSCCAQQTDTLFISSANKPLKLEILIKDIDLGEKFKKPIFNQTFNNPVHLTIEETINHLGLPFLNEAKWLLNLYYNIVDDYREFKRFKNSFTSYEIQINKNIGTSLYLTNFRNLKNFSDYELILNLNILF
jgi:hypothetical protein